MLGKKKKGSTQRDRKARGAPDLVKRNFRASKPNKLWVADLKIVPTDEGRLYLAMVLKVFSRLLVGWAMSSRKQTELVIRALGMAVAARRPRAVVHHSDKGSQYTPVEFGQRSRELGVRLLTGSVDDCFDNAMAESFLCDAGKGDDQQEKVCQPL